MAPFWAWTRGSPDKAELGFGPGPPAAGLGLAARAPGGAQVHPEEVGGNPPECGIGAILGKSRNVRRSDSFIGINNNTPSLYKVCSL